MLPMGRLSAAAALFLAAGLLTVCSPASGQGADNANAVPVLATEAPAPQAAAAAVGPSTSAGALPPNVDAQGDGSVYNNRTVGVQHVVEAGGCLILAITGAQGVCLQDSTFSVNNVTIPRPADYEKDGLSAPNNNTAKGNDTSCTKKSPGVQQIFETEGCALRDAAVAAGLDPGVIQDSFVCKSSSVDTTNFDRAFPAAVCKAAAAAAGKSLSSGNASSASGSPCTASRTLVIVTNPCTDQAVTMNATERFFLAPDSLAPGLQPELAPMMAPALAPAPGPAAAGAPGPAANAPGPGMAAGPAPGNGSPAASPTRGAAASAVTPSSSPTPAPTSAAPRSSSTAGIAAAAVGVFACLAALA